jgi:hypothetical protein
MKFGILKSKIENVLLESYSNDTFKVELKNFKKLVLENKNIAKIFYLYDELNSPKALNETYVNEFINESVKLYEKSLSKITNSDFNKLNEWVKNSKAENSYETIDNLFSNDVLTIESRIKSKKFILESLSKSKKEEYTDMVKLPVSKIVDVANKTISDYLSSINESEREEVKKILAEDNNKLLIKYDVLKESTLDKLNDLKSTNDDTEVTSRINQTINKLNNETYNRVNYYKLKELFTNL